MSLKIVEKLNNMDNLKKQIIDTGLFLQEKGLIARTWGNVSARLNDSEFLITPSGKAYDDIKEEDIALVNIEDCSYDKNGPKPSSEKKVHSVIYKNRKEINYIVHTHQFYASAICSEGFSVTLDDGTFLPCARYGLPGTNKLKKNVEKEVISNKDSDMILMEKHGAIIFAKTLDEVLKKTEYLEKQCEILFKRRVKEYDIPKHMDAYNDDYAQISGSKTDDKEALEMVTLKNAASLAYARDGKPISKFDRCLQHLVYVLKYSKLKGKSK